MILTALAHSIEFLLFFECSKYFSLNFDKSPDESILANSTFYRPDILLFWFKVMVPNNNNYFWTLKGQNSEWLGPMIPVLLSVKYRLINPPSHLSLIQLTATFFPTSKCFVIGPHFVCSFDGAQDTCPYFFGVGTQRFFRGFLHLIFGMVGMWSFLLHFILHSPLLQSRYWMLWSILYAASAFLHPS